MFDDFDIPSNTKDLDNALHVIHSKFIKPKEKESKANKKYLKQVLENLVSEMKEDVVFKAVYGRLCFQGSTYEKLNVGSPNEFDINLELRLPVDYAKVKIETLETLPGFTRIQLGTVTDKKGEQVQKTAKKWIDDSGYLLREKILQWLQGLVDTVLSKTKSENLQEILRSRNGPAITLQFKTTELSVDLVPCLVFDGENLPANIQKILDGLDSKSYESRKWFLVPKGPKHGSDGREWRMSFYEYEKSLMNDLGGMKPTIKLLKLLRDKWRRTNVSSYYIKTMFLWEICKQGRIFWKKKDHGYLFVYMLRVFEEHMLSTNVCIPFFWDGDHNLVGHLDPNDLQNLGNFLKKRRNKLENALRTHDNPVEVLYGIFIHKEPCLENGIQANQCLENITYDFELQGRHLVQDEMEEEMYMPMVRHGTSCKEPCLENGIQANQCLEHVTHNFELQRRRLLQNEKEEEKQLQLQKENEGSFFNWKSLLFGLGAVAVAAVGAVAVASVLMAKEETQGESGEDRARRRREDREQKRGGA